MLEVFFFYNSYFKNSIIILFIFQMKTVIISFLLAKVIAQGKFLKKIFNVVFYCFCDDKNIYTPMYYKLVYIWYIIVKYNI